MTSENRNKLKKAWDRYTGREFCDRDGKLPPMPGGNMLLVYARRNGQLYEVIFNVESYSWIYKINEDVVHQEPSDLNSLLKTLDKGTWEGLLLRCKNFEKSRCKQA